MSISANWSRSNDCRYGGGETTGKGRELESIHFGFLFAKRGSANGGESDESDGEWLEVSLRLLMMLRRLLVSTVLLGKVRVFVRSVFLLRRGE